MSEAEAGPREEEPTPREKMEPAAVKKVKENRRSPSTDVGSEVISLHTICYKGTTLKLPGDQDHMYQVAFRILKVYNLFVDQILVGLPLGWANIDNKPDNATIASYIKKYNLAAKPYAKNWGGSYNTETLREWGSPHCTMKVAVDITTFAYECAVPRPADLNNHYKSFSSETYGETNLEQMASIIDELQIGPNDVFVDLGSGIGQLVCFTAAYARVKKAVGIELSSTPAKKAADLSEYFRKIMNHFGKQCSKFELIKGNFLDPKFKELICEEATVIFINNYAFGPDLMFQITNTLLQDLKHGTRIVTTKPFGTHKREITYRSTSDINSMSHTTELTSIDSCVSWTANKVVFYLTTMDHTKLIKYYEEEKRKKLDAKNSREGSEVAEPTKKRKHDRDVHRDKIKMEHTAKKPREESSFASSSTSSSGAITATTATDNNSMPSTSSSSVPAAPSQPTVVHTSEDDVFYGRTTRKMWKAQTEQAAASNPHQSPKWNEPDTDYTPPAKKPKKHRENGETKASADHSTSSKKKKCPSVPKTPKPPKNSQSNRHHSYSVEPASVQKQMPSVSHHTPSLPKATASPPSIPEQKPKVEELTEAEKSYGQLDAKTKVALETIREAASTSTQAAAIQDAIETVLAQPELSPVSQAAAAAAAAQPAFVLAQNLPAPVPVYPPTQIMAPPPPPPPPNVIPPSSELVAEQRHTFMIPPTDPLYNMVVSMYFQFKNYCNQAKMGDPVFMSQLRHEIENEKVRHNELQEAINVTNSQIDSFLAKGVTFLKDRLDELGMTRVTDVTELLSGSKQIVTHHKSLTNTVAQLEATVALEEQKLRMVGGPDAVKLFDEALKQKIDVDLMKLADLVVLNRPTNYGNHAADELSASDAKISPSRRPRQKPRQTNTGGGKRGPSANRKSDATNEDVDVEIKQFVQRAMELENAVKEKERKARGNMVAAERGPRKSDK